MQVNLFKWFERLKSWILELVKSRMFVLIIVFCVLTGVLVQRVFYLQIVSGQEYLDDYTLKIQKTKEVQGTRGRILDRNGVVLADNRLAYSVTLEDNGVYDTTAEKNEVINETIGRVIDIVEANGDSIISNFKIVLNDNGEYEYTMDEGTSRLRFIADVYGLATIDKLSDEQKNCTAQQMIDYLCTDKKYGYGIEQEAYTKAEVLKRVNIRYAMSLNRFQKYVATTIASDVSEQTKAAIMENLDSLQGINIAEESLRSYNDSKYFASLIGYTGQISQSEYDNLDKEDQKKYSLTDIVGKAGLEQVMDEQLQGSKGEIKMYVNNVGKVIESIQVSESGAGNDVYLSIDANLQKVAYDLLEEKLAGILLAKIQNVMEYDRNQVGDDSDVVIPIGDVYNAFFANEILDTNHFAEKDAGVTEAAVNQSFTARKESVLSAIQTQLESADADAYSNCSKEMQAYQSYIVSTLLTSNTSLLLTDKIDKNDATYLQWENDESISLYTYLNYAISQNWVDTSLLKNYLNEDSTYNDLNETYQGLVKLILSKLSQDSQFDKLIYRYMIRSGEITGRQICMMIYEQGVLDYDETQYQNLDRGAISAYDFVRNAIDNLQITPGQLGLEPCTGSVVVTDPNTGKLLACVSYPGYDNNRLANTMDSAYYSKLLHDQASPLYNNATQERTAPGSTYKPLVAVAGLTEGVIDTQSTVTCTGVYDKTYLSPKCWIYPKSHGTLNVVGGIQHSCNVFFYEVGYRLGLTGQSTESGEERSEDQGLATLAKYATSFGLNQTTGIEIPESEPKISDEDSVRSAIGQGTNNYTTTQLARYITAVANKGTVYNLTLLDKVTDVSGQVVEQQQSDILNKITDVSSGTWSTVQQGMRAVITSSHTYDVLGDFEMSGKTGTAQQSKTHANHGLFVGFAPSSNPEIAFAIRIKNGYESSYVGQIGRDLVRYYYGLTDYSELVTGKASTLSGTVHSD